LAAAFFLAASRSSWGNSMAPAARQHAKDSGAATTMASATAAARARQRSRPAARIPPDMAASHAVQVHGNAAE
jgi:hypothetical protein